MFSLTHIPPVTSDFHLGTAIRRLGLRDKGLDAKDCKIATKTAIGDGKTRVIFSIDQFKGQVDMGQMCGITKFKNLDTPAPNSSRFYNKSLNASS